ncbi:MAG: hypothetical protein NC548_26495 [Lachnospiraceae bacterium]|nr:hypothetical protein [Lachnospiraceae bacterium]
MKKAEAERIILGSGYIHLKTYEKGQEIPNPEDFCEENTLFAYIKGGATIEYAPEFYEAKDDMQKVAKAIVTNEEVTLKTGIMTFTGNTIAKLCDTARVSERENTVSGKKYRVVQIGGAGNAKGEKYVICFHHVDKVDRDIYLMIIGQNQAGFSLAFAKDSETVVDAEFHALPSDGEGTLVTYTEEIIGEESGGAAAGTQGASGGSSTGSGKDEEAGG